MLAVPVKSLPAPCEASSIDGPTSATYYGRMDFVGTSRNGGCVGRSWCQSITYWFLWSGWQDLNPRQPRPER